MPALSLSPCFKWICGFSGGGIDEQKRVSDFDEKKRISGFE
jgi:hypothetical protein